jgi:formylglycine-generating enzyme required for sulfatase activity
MNRPVEINEYSWLKRWVIGFGSMIGFMILFLAFSQRHTPPITRPQCEADGDYVFVGGGNYIKGSSIAERDYAYQISAQLQATNSTDLETSLQQLKKQNKFAQEHNSELETLPPFCIGRNLVTNADYQVFIRATGHATPTLTEQEYRTQRFSSPSYTDIKPYFWKGDRYPVGQGDHPVVLISQKDAIAYSRWKSKQGSYSYRLPSADEWEKAARGRDGRYFPWGNLWEGDRTEWQSSFRTMSVGQYPFKPSPFKVKDMVGTVLQLTNTVEFRGTYVAVTLKGCIWGEPPGACRAAAKQARPVRLKHVTHGFRLIKDGK